jgi:hypothetical protein
MPALRPLQNSANNVQFPVDRRIRFSRRLALADVCDNLRQPSYAKRGTRRSLVDGLHALPSVWMLRGGKVREYDPREPLRRFTEGEAREVVFLRQRVCPPWHPESVPLRACASRQSLVSSDCRNRSPSTKKCVCQVLPRFLSAIVPPNQTNFLARYSFSFLCQVSRLSLRSFQRLHFSELQSVDLK